MHIAPCTCTVCLHLHLRVHLHFRACPAIICPYAAPTLPLHCPYTAPTLPCPIPQHRVSTGLRQGGQALEAACLAARSAALARVLLRVRPRHAPLRPHGRQPHLQADPLGERRGAAQRVEGGAHGLPVDRRMHDTAARHASAQSASRSQQPPPAAIPLPQRPPTLLTAALLTAAAWAREGCPRHLAPRRGCAMACAPVPAPKSASRRGLLTLPLVTALSSGASRAPRCEEARP